MLAYQALYPVKNVATRLLTKERMDAAAPNRVPVNSCPKPGSLRSRSKSHAPHVSAMLIANVITEINLRASIDTVLHHSPNVARRRTVHRDRTNDFDLPFQRTTARHQTTASPTTTYIFINQYSSWKTSET